MLLSLVKNLKTKEPLTLEKEMIIWQYCLNNKERISLAMSLGLYAGLRIGEICALKMGRY